MNLKYIMVRPASGRDPGCFRVMDTEAAPPLLGHCSVHDAERVASEISTQIAAASEEGK